MAVAVGRIDYPSSCLSKTIHLKFSRTESENRGLVRKERRRRDSSIVEGAGMKNCPGGGARKKREKIKREKREERKKKTGTRAGLLGSLLPVPRE